MRAQLRKATREVVVLGPWIDDYFAQALLEACAPSVALRVITRPVDAVDAGFVDHAAAALDRFLCRPGTEVRTERRLHAKLIVIDEHTVFCGSANWYRYSLDEGLELVLTGPVADVPTLMDEVASIWDRGVPCAAGERAPGSRADAARHPREIQKGYQKEVLDPLAAAALASVRDAFVLGRKGIRRPK